MPASSSASVRLPTTATHTVAPSTISTPQLPRASATRQHQGRYRVGGDRESHAGSPRCRVRARQKWFWRECRSSDERRCRARVTTLASARPSKITDAGPQRRPQLGGEELRLFPGGELALVDLVEWGWARSRASSARAWAWSISPSPVGRLRWPPVREVAGRPGRRLRSAVEPDERPGPLQVGLRPATAGRHLGPNARRVERSYWSGMRSVKNSTSSDAAGGSRLLRATTT
jgi:hypothetical protein